MDHGAGEFLNAQALLDQSHPRARRSWAWYGLGIFLLVSLASTYVARQSAQMKMLVDFLSMLLLFAVAGGMMLWGSYIARQHRNEQANVEMIEECVQLRRWDDAANMLQLLLSRPMRSAQARVQSLLFLTSVLSRFHRFEQAEIVEDYILSLGVVDPGTTYGLKLARAMAMLRQDHLADANQAISEIRQMTGGQPSAGLSLLQMYRDIKTGHPAEAIEQFNRDQTVMRDQLGFRLADAYAFLAKAHHQLAQQDPAAAMWANATTLSAADELVRRYPELTDLATTYPSTALPAEVNG